MNSKRGHALVHIYKNKRAEFLPNDNCPLGTGEGEFIRQSRKNDLLWNKNEIYHLS